MLSDDELPPLPDYLSPGTVHEYARAVERAAYERAAARVIEMIGDREVADAIRALGREK
jgi:hypothetical protein